MITQKLIILKIDKELLENLDTECQRTLRKRNACIKTGDCAPQTQPPDYKNLNH